MGRFPDCCCCRCTAAMMSIIPRPSAGIPISGQPWKWKCRTCCDFFSWWDGKNVQLFKSRWKWQIKKTFLDNFKWFVCRNSYWLKMCVFVIFFNCWNTNVTHWSVGEHHVFEREGFTLCISSQLHGIISKCYTALWWPILEALFLVWQGQMEKQSRYIWEIYNLYIFFFLCFHNTNNIKQRHVCEEMKRRDTKRCCLNAFTFARVPHCTCSLSLSSVSVTIEWHLHSHTILQKSSTVWDKGPWVAIK